MVSRDPFIQRGREFALIPGTDKVVLLIWVGPQIVKSPGFTKRFMIVLEPTAVGVRKRTNAYGATPEYPRVAFDECAGVFVIFRERAPLEDWGQGGSGHI